jgi:hypothetical protein
MDTLSSIQDWYLRQCDGEWEHSWGIKIETLDNPGWSVRINLQGTALCERTFNEVQVNRSETDWTRCFVRENQFQAYCGAKNLEEILAVFRQFAESPD